MEKKLKPQADIIVGRNPVVEALKGDTNIEKIFLLYGVHGGIIDKIKFLAKGKRIPVVEVDQKKLSDIAGESFNQGVAAKITPKQFVDIDEIIKIASFKNEKAFILILDEIQDPQNLGAIIRTAECAGVHGVIIPKHHAAQISAVVIKSSAGAVEHMPISQVTNIAQTLDELKKNGLWIIGADGEAQKNFYDIDYNIPIGIVIGSEGYGIRRLVKEKCDFLVKIPMFGKTGSLNASVAAGILLFETIRKRLSW